MESLHQIETIILLLAAVLALTTIAHTLLIPYAILLVIGGLILGLIPGLPAIHLNPDLVFLVFLPPILWAAAYFTSPSGVSSQYPTYLHAGGGPGVGDDGRGRRRGSRRVAGDGVG